MYGPRPPSSTDQLSYFSSVSTGTGTLLRPSRKVSSMMQAAAGTTAPTVCEQGDRRGKGAAGGEQVVDQHHALALLGWGVGLDLDLVGAVLERIGVAHRDAGQLALLAQHHEAGAERHGEWCGQQEAAQFDAGQHVGLVRADAPPPSARSSRARPWRAPAGSRCRRRGCRAWGSPGSRPDMVLEVHLAPC